MSKLDDMIGLSPIIYDKVMEVCEDTVLDDNELEDIARKVQLHFEDLVHKKYGAGL